MRRGRPKTTYLQVTQTQLKEKHIQTLEDAVIEAKDKRQVVSNHPGPKLNQCIWVYSRSSYRQCQDLALVY